jgi:RND family efflux transporter MFP subunit
MTVFRGLSTATIGKAAIAVLIVGAFTSVVAVRLTAQTPTPDTQSRALPVRTTEVKIEPGYFARRSFTGRAVAGRTSQMAFELGGTISAVNADLGSEVIKGDILASLDTSRLNANKNQVLAERDEAEASLKLANRTLKRAQDTFKQGHASAQRLDEAEANAIALAARLKRLDASLETIDVDIRKSSIKAPFSGTITNRMLDEGTVVSGGLALLEITENTRMEAHIGMPPEHAEAIKNGSKFQLRDGRRKIIEAATVRSVVPQIEGQTRTMMVTFDIPANSVSSGELVSAVVESWQEATGAWLPLRALSSDVRGLWRVYKVVQATNDPYVRFENVQILYSDKSRAFVTGTISNGDNVISDGISRLAPGQRVRLNLTPTGDRS